MEAGRVVDPEALLPLIVKEIRYDGAQESARLPVPVGLAPDVAELVELGYATPLSQSLASFPSAFDAAVRGLEGPERDAYILTELRGLTLREAADVLDTSHITVHRRAEVARHIVREEITT